MPQCATGLRRSLAPPLVLLEPVSVLALLHPHPEGQQGSGLPASE